MRLVPQVLILLVSILQLQFKKQEELRIVGSDASCTAVSNPLWNYKKLCDISMAAALTPLFLSICPNLPYFSRRLDWLCFSPTKLAQLDGLVKKCWRRKVICSPSSAAAALRGRRLAQHHNKGAWSSIRSNEISIKSFAKGANLIRILFAAGCLCRCNCWEKERWWSPGLQENIQTLSPKF